MEGDYFICKIFSIMLLQKSVNFLKKKGWRWCKDECMIFKDCDMKKRHRRNLYLRKMFKTLLFEQLNYKVQKHRRKNVNYTTQVQKLNCILCSFCKS